MRPVPTPPLLILSILSIHVNTRPYRALYSGGRFSTKARADS